jgi:hypothetical protein
MCFTGLVCRLKRFTCSSVKHNVCEGVCGGGGERVSLVFEADVLHWLSVQADMHQLQPCKVKNQGDKGVV